MLRQALFPRQNQVEYEKVIQPFLELTIFLDGGAPCGRPFVDAAGCILARSQRSSAKKLSIKAMKDLNGKSVSEFIYPPEETFIVLTMAKYLLGTLNSEDIKEFTAPANGLDPVSPWKGTGNDSVAKEDLAFFFKNSRAISDIFVRDLNESDTSKRWLMMDFNEELHPVTDMKMENQDTLDGNGSSNQDLDEDENVMWGGFDIDMARKQANKLQSNMHGLSDDLAAFENNSGTAANKNDGHDGTVNNNEGDVNGNNLCPI